MGVQLIYNGVLVSAVQKSESVIYKHTNELIYKTEIESQMQKTNYGYPWGKRRRGKLGDWD